jgi:hypothetical protein
MDVYLFRSLKNGSQYDSLFSKSTGEIVELGKGDTDYSIDKMVDWILLHQHQTQKIAPLLKKSSLEQTCKAIHEFAFWHFQYKADTSDQLLRSPNHAWQNRVDGIDCKSYSIIASCILHNLGINHYIRKVAYTTPGEYTHVYVVVPQNQKTNNLTDGFYMIDGTINTMQEPYYLEEKDEYMSGLKHYGLNAPSQLNGDFSIEDLAEVFNSIEAIDCIGGSSLTEAGLKTYLGNIDTYYANLFQKINQGVKNYGNGDFESDAQLALAIAEFFGNSKTFTAASIKNKTKGWNSCTSKRIDVATKAHTFYRDTVGNLFTAWLTKYFDKDTQYVSPNPVNESYSSKDAEKNYGFRHTNLDNPIVTVQRAFYYDPKPLQIPAFEVTPFVADFAGTNSNPMDYLSTLTNVAANYLPAGNSNSGTTPISAGGSYVQENAAQPTTKTAGGGWGGLILGLAALGFVMTRKTATTAAKTTARKSSTRKSK